MRIRSLLLGCFYLAGCVAEVGDDGPVGGDVAANQQAVQWNSMGFWELRWGTQWDALDPAIGVIRSIPLPGTTAKGSCGITFISPHFGVTAAHCVDNKSYPNIATANVVVQQYNTQNLTGLPGGQELWDQAQVSGSWPNWTRADPLTCGEGYCLTFNQGTCRIRRRCSRAYGKENCPMELGNLNAGAGVDIALIECSSRPANAAFAGVHPGNDAIGDKVEIRWYHEVVHLDVDQGEGTSPTGNYSQYSVYSGPGAAGYNYHYTKNDGAQLLPLRSRAWPATGNAYRVVSHGGTESFTDAFACHGTSGSGIFLAGSTWLFGPAIGVGTPQPWINRLCVDVDDYGNSLENQPIVSHLRPSHVRVLEALVVYDR